VEKISFSSSAVGSFRAEASRIPAAFLSGMVAIAILVIDQSTKVMVRSLIPPCGRDVCAGYDAGPIAVINQTNTGGAFSFGPGSALWVLLAMVSVLIVPVYGLGIRGATTRTRTLPLALGLVAGGAMGNLTDRLLYGGVTDFLVPGGPVTFNIADVAAVTGTVMAIALLLRNRARLKARRTS
jgi:signal peptidase II